MQKVLEWTLVVVLAAGVGSAVTYRVAHPGESDRVEVEVEDVSDAEFIGVGGDVDEPWPEFRLSDPRRIQEMIDRDSERLDPLFVGRSIDDVRRRLGEPDRTVSRYRADGHGGFRFVYYGLSRPEEGTRAPELLLFFSGDRVSEVRLQREDLAGR